MLLNSSRKILVSFLNYNALLLSQILGREFKIMITFSIFFFQTLIFFERLFSTCSPNNKNSVYESFYSFFNDVSKELSF